MLYSGSPLYINGLTAYCEAAPGTIHLSQQN